MAFFSLQKLGLWKMWVTLPMKRMLGECGSGGDVVEEGEEVVEEMVLGWQQEECEMGEERTTLVEEHEGVGVTRMWAAVEGGAQVLLYQI